MRGTRTGSATSLPGFSLIELAVVVTIVLILAGGAVPNILGSIQRGRVQTAALQVAQDLRLVRGNATLYQVDLYFYVSADTAANRWYYYEQLSRLGSGSLPDGTHNVPPADGAALPDPGRFVRSNLPFNMHVVSVSFLPAASPKPFNGHAYSVIDFRSGKDGNIPGSIAASVTIVVGDSAGRTWRVVVDAVGRAHVVQGS